VSQARWRVRPGVDLLEFDACLDPPDDDLLALDEALTKLADFDAHAADVVKLKVFVGLTIEAIARQMQISQRTVKRNWAFARALLRASMGRDCSACGRS
jgi:DNA-directed RNA polymerase specialized sigma24 family protein